MNKYNWLLFHPSTSIDHFVSPPILERQLAMSPICQFQDKESIQNEALERLKKRFHQGDICISTKHRNPLKLSLYL